MKSVGTGPPVLLVSSGSIGLDSARDAAVVCNGFETARLGCFDAETGGGGGGHCWIEGLPTVFQSDALVFFVAALVASFPSLFSTSIGTVEIVPSFPSTGTICVSYFGSSGFGEGTGVDLGVDSIFGLPCVCFLRSAMRLTMPLSCFVFFELRKHLPTQKRMMRRTKAPMPMPTYIGVREKVNFSLAA